MGKLNVQCFICIHNEVCMFSNEYKAAIKALEEVSFCCGNDGVAKIRETTWLDMVLKCTHSMGVWEEGAGNET